MTTVERAAPDVYVQASEDTQPEHPFRELTEGWVRVPRGPRRPGSPRVQSHFVMRLDPERTAWLLAEAERQGNT